MSSGAHDSGVGLGRSAGASAARGIAVIVVAVAIGLLLLNRGLDDDEVVAGADEEPTVVEGADEEAEGEAQDATTTETTVAGEPTVTTAAGVTTTTPATEARPAGEVTVLVLNGSGQQGAAGRGAAFFTEQGYLTADPKNALENGPSAIYYAEGFAAEADAAAAALDLDPALVLQPLDPAAPPIDDTQGAQLIVMAGTDGVISF